MSDIAASLSRTDRPRMPMHMTADRAVAARSRASRSMPNARPFPLLLALLAATACGAVADRAAPQTGSAVGSRAILISFDALHEAGLAILPDSVAPTFRRLFAEGACAAWVRPAFPSVTAATHAAIWTGAWGDVNGIVANTQPRLPRDTHSLLDLVSGYLVPGARAEPIWITAAANSVRVFAQHVTQAPSPPEYRPLRTGVDVERLAALRAEAEAALAWQGADVLNGYNAVHARDTVITATVAPARAAADWRNVEQLAPRGLPPLEIAWRNGPDSVFALLHGERAYTHITAAMERDVAVGVTAAATPADRSPVRGRELARHFSPAAAFPLPSGGSGFLRVRLFELAPDASSFLVYQAGVPDVEANRADVLARYHAAVRGWVRNGATDAYRRGHLGPTLFDDGNGEAEARYVETLELVTRQFMRGAALGWDTLGARLLIDYLPILDEALHRLYGLIAEASPAWSPARSALALDALSRAWEIADLRLQDLQGRVDGDAESVLFVTGDHGMRPAWRIFRPNVALAQAGLLAVGAGGEIDLSQTRALAPSGYWISVNTTDWKGGIVDLADSAAAVGAAERALLAARGADGQPIVTRVWRATEHDSLGLGGPAGGDLYFQLAPGYRYSWEPRSPMVLDAQPTGEHGFPSVDPDMRTSFCAWGAAFPAHRIEAIASTDIAPTLAEWMGLPPPRHARGNSVLAALLGR